MDGTQDCTRVVLGRVLVVVRRCSLPHFDRRSIDPSHLYRQGNTSIFDTFLLASQSQYSTFIRLRRVIWLFPSVCFQMPIQIACIRRRKVLLAAMG